MRLFSYVVARDFGFAPNPFGGVCTLATCKPEIRQHAAVGDWIAGLASASDSRVTSLVYVMRVDEILTYDTYWTDPRFQTKKPSRGGSVKQLFGDNIYHRVSTGHWVQADSHHSYDGSINLHNVENDTQSQGVLIGQRFAYWGSAALRVPDLFLDFNGETIKVARGHKNRFGPDFVASFANWFEGLGVQGYLAPPFTWQRPMSKWASPVN